MCGFFNGWDMIDFIAEYWLVTVVVLLMASVFMGLLAVFWFVALMRAFKKDHEKTMRRFDELRKLNGKATNHRIDL